MTWFKHECHYCGHKSRRVDFIVGDGNHQCVFEDRDDCERRRCERFGHHLVAHELRYEQGKTLAYVGGAIEQTEVGVTWVNDETCSRCGYQVWWPA